jgi:hypothetical protein
MSHRMIGSVGRREVRRKCMHWSTTTRYSTRHYGPKDGAAVPRPEDFRRGWHHAKITHEVIWSSKSSKLAFFVSGIFAQRRVRGDLGVVRGRPQFRCTVETLNVWGQVPPAAQVLTHRNYATQPHPLRIPSLNCAVECNRAVVAWNSAASTNHL